MDGFVALYIFLLAAITGYEIISKAPVILHTPLLSASNFIHGIILIGAMMIMTQAETTTQTVIGFIAVALAAANIVGGYVVTSRMLNILEKSDSNNLTGDK